LTIECAGDPGTCDSFRDGVDSRQISATRFSSSGAVSVRIATLVITVEGTRRLTSKDQCKNGQREVLGFANQGQCVRFVETGKASDQGNSPPTGIFTMVSAGGLLHTCGLTTAGATYCWGKNSNGAMGDGPFQRLIPEAVPGLPSFAAVSAAYSHTCGLTAGGTAYCWGDNFNGALGDGTTTSRSTPAFVAGGLSFAAVSAGSDLTCGVTVAGAAFCWGNNESGQLGDGTETDRAAPVLVAP
jgi:alpha-tubulin suppressor-like RCC1 family protein